jgi:hypothetical protein
MKEPIQAVASWRGAARVENVRRRSYLLQGLVLAVVPAALFVPAAAFFTICPPEYGSTIMAIILVAFAGSEILAGWNLSRVLQRRLDWLGGTAIGGMFLAALVLGAVAWGFIAPVLASRSGF